MEKTAGRRVGIGKGCSIKMMALKGPSIINGFLLMGVLLRGLELVSVREVE